MEEEESEMDRFLERLESEAQTIPSMGKTTCVSVPPLPFKSILISSSALLLNPLHTIPLARQILLPQAHLVIAPAHRQHIAAQTPTDPPCNSFEVERD